MLSNQRVTFLSAFILAAFAVMPLISSAASKSAFDYSGRNTSALPIPPSEREIQTVEPNEIAVAGNAGQTLEGALFAPNGDFLFCNVSDGKVQRLTPDGKLEEVLEIRDFAPGGLAWHKDGRLFVAGINQKERKGGIIAFSPANKSTETIIDPSAGYLPNDLVFDREGGFCFSDFRGSATQPDGGLYYVAPDLKSITQLIPNMAQANGAALSPDGRMLWATEYGRSLLHRVNPDSATTVPLTGSKILYHFTGPAPDSMRVDNDGNVYVALVGQGRVLIFNLAGIPIGQVLLPGRDQGLNLRSTSLAFHPEKPEMRIVSGNTKEAASKEAKIFSAPALGRVVI